MAWFWANAGSPLLCPWQQPVLWACCGCSQQFACTEALVPHQWSNSSPCTRGSVGLFSCAVCWINFYFHCDSFYMEKSTLFLAKPFYYSLHCKRKAEMLLSANVYMCGECVIRRGGSTFLFWRKIKIIINYISFVLGVTQVLGKKIQGTLAVHLLKPFFFFRFYVVWSTKWSQSNGHTETQSYHWASLSAGNGYSASGSWMSLQGDHKKFVIL